MTLMFRVGNVNIERFQSFYSPDRHKAWEKLVKKYQIKVEPYFASNIWPAAKVIVKSRPKEVSLNICGMIFGKFKRAKSSKYIIGRLEL